MNAESAGFHNPLVRAARKLKQKKHRLEQRCFLVEGPSLVAAALEAGATIERAFVSGGDFTQLLATLHQRMIDVVAVDRRTMTALSQTRSPQGLLAVVRFLHAEIDKLEMATGSNGPALVLVLHDLDDPGNVGTLIRSAEGFGASAVCFGSHSVEPYNDKVVRASMGALFRVPMYWYDSWARFLEAARRAQLSVVATEAAAPDVRSCALPDRVALLVGNERSGLTTIPQGDIALRVGIPQRPSVNSLNAAVAGSIMLHEIARATGVLAAGARTNDL